MIAEKPDQGFVLTLFTTLMDTVEDIFLLTNGGEDYAQAVIIEVSAGFKRATELSLQELIEKPCSAVFYQASQASAHCPITEAFQSRKAFVTELHMSNLQGISLRFNFSIKPVVNDNGQNDCWLWHGCLLNADNIARSDYADISALKAMQLMASSLSHELNNIFAVILGNAELIMSKSELSEMFVPLLQSITRSTTKGVELTESLQWFAQKNTGKKQDVVVDQLIASLELSSFGHKLNLRQPLSINLHSQMRKINVDPQRLVSCIHQMLTNASQAIGPEGNVSIETNLVYIQNKTDFFQQVLVSDEYVQIKISDNGMGIPSADLPKIFNPYFSSKKKLAGQGLGLSLVYGFLQECQGYCFVSSNETQGSSFTLLFKPVY